MNIIKNHKSSFLFITGIFLVIFGIVWIWLIFYSEIEESEINSLNPEESKTFQLYLTDKGLAYYKISIINYELQTLFVQIMEAKNNVIEEQKIDTKMSVNFFEYELDGIYNIRITNISEKTTEFKVEYGDSKSEELAAPIIPSIIGILLIIFTVYRKMMTFNIKHP